MNGLDKQALDRWLTTEPESTFDVGDILEELTDDGDTFELSDGRTLRLRIEPDAGTTINDFDCYGKMSKYAFDYVHDAHAPRPDGFNGNAEKIQVDRGYWVWWQPPDDIPRSSEQFSEFRRMVRDLLEIGFYQVGLELLDGTDAYGRPIVVKQEWLGGVDSIEEDHLADILSDMLAELDLT